LRYIFYKFCWRKTVRRELFSGTFGGHDAYLFLLLRKPDAGRLIIRGFPTVSSWNPKL
jgi:hypothetical protein